MKSSEVSTLKTPSGYVGYLMNGLFTKKIKVVIYERNGNHFDSPR